LSFPRVIEEETTPEGIMHLLDEGAWFYAPGIIRDDETLIRRAKDAYVIEKNDDTQELLRSFSATREGAVELAFFLAFAGVEYL